MGSSGDVGWARSCVCGQPAGYLGPGRSRTASRMCPALGCVFVGAEEREWILCVSPSSRLLRLVHGPLGERFYGSKDASMQGLLRNASELAHCHFCCFHWPQNSHRPPQIREVGSGGEEPQSHVARGVDTGWGMKTRPSLQPTALAPSQGSGAGSPLSPHARPTEGWNGCGLQPPCALLSLEFARFFPPQCLSDSS